MDKRRQKTLAIDALRAYSPRGVRSLMEWVNGLPEHSEDRAYAEDIVDFFSEKNGGGERIFITEDFESSPLIEEILKTTTLDFREDFVGRDILSIDDFSKDEINFVLKHARRVENNPKWFQDSMDRKIMLPLFFEPSTRTDLSFQMAMMKMNGRVADFDVNQSSVNKGERLRDTIRMVDGYEPDVIVMRHKNDGAVRAFARDSEAPIINAGDGKNQHPTQTLLDLYSIKKIRGSIDGTNIVIAGDLKYGRTPHSLAMALARYRGCKVSFVSPDSLKMPRDLIARLGLSGITFSEHDLRELPEMIQDADVLYMTRIQRERFPEGPEGQQEYSRVSSQYCLTPDMLKDAGSKLRVMHPLPRVNEIDMGIDELPQAYYFQQAKNGLYVRKSLLFLVTGAKED